MAPKRQTHDLDGRKTTIIAACEERDIGLIKIRARMARGMSRQEAIDAGAENRPTGGQQQGNDEWKNLSDADRECSL